VGCGLEFMGHVPRYLASLNGKRAMRVRIRGRHEAFSKPAITTASRDGASKAA
jgi:hypothetical protein